MKRMIRRSACTITCAFLLFTAGCHQTDYAEEGKSEVEETTEMEEEVVEIPDESMEEAQEEEEESSVKQEEVVENNAEQEQREIDCEYSSFLWKSWIVDEPVSGNDQFGFIITKVNDKEIEGVIVIGGDADDWYWYGNERCELFKGTITENQAVCTFQYEGCQAEAVFLFQEHDRIEAGVKCDQMDIDMRYQFRPYRFSDISVALNDDLFSATVYLETWGEVNLISATIDDNHSYPILFLTDEEGNILYEDSCVNGLSFLDIFVEDLNQDGRQDIWVILSNTIDAGLQGGGLVNVFYQTGDGRFCHRSQTGTYDAPNRYFGEYLVTRFCPAENYADISETVLTFEEAEQMIGKKIVIQREFFLTCDSERRRGIREDRKLSAEECMITEYHDTSPDYYCESVLVDEGGKEEYPYIYMVSMNESLREAIDEEYYEKINYVFYNSLFPWQQFYTLEGEDKLIMHSMLTGQNFILEKEEVNK